jgi:hypothetical protein
MPVPDWPEVDMTVEIDRSDGVPSAAIEIRLSNHA